MGERLKRAASGIRGIRMLSRLHLPLAASNPTAWLTFL